MGIDDSQFILTYDFGRIYLWPTVHHAVRRPAEKNLLTWLQFSVMGV